MHDCPYCGQRLPPVETDKDLQTLQETVRAVADDYGVSPAAILSGDRRRRYTTPRHLTWAILRHTTDLSYQEIADNFNIQDHTSIINGVRRADRQTVAKFLRP